MSGWIYLIKNGDLYKIGITKNFESRMRQLKPDKILAKLYSSKFLELEKEFHKRYKNVRIPQTEYFRLDDLQIRDFKERIMPFNFSIALIFRVFIESFLLLSLFFLIFTIYLSLTINNMNIVFMKVLFLLENLALIFSLLSLIRKSGRNYNYFNEIKYRVIRSLFFIIFLLSFKYILDIIS
tara:strand:- start:444 stop:986 length:543 start_codon:yes stop_codon:yes gene_type:complete